MKEVEKEGKRESRRETKRGREEKGQHQLESQVSSRFKSCHHGPPFKSGQNRKSLFAGPQKFQSEF